MQFKELHEQKVDRYTKEAFLGQEQREYQMKQIQDDSEKLQQEEDAVKKKKMEAVAANLLEKIADKLGTESETILQESPLAVRWVKSVSTGEPLEPEAQEKVKLQLIAKFAGDTDNEVDMSLMGTAVEAVMNLDTDIVTDDLELQFESTVTSTEVALAAVPLIRKQLRFSNIPAVKLTSEEMTDL